MTVYTCLILLVLLLALMDSSEYEQAWLLAGEDVDVLFMMLETPF